MNKAIISTEELRKFIEDRMKGITREFPTMTGLTTAAPQPVPTQDDAYSRRIIFAMWIVISAIYLALYYLLHLWAKGKNARKRAETEARIEASIRAEQERIRGLPEVRPIMRKQSRRRQRSSSGARVHFDAKTAVNQVGSPCPSSPDEASPSDEASANVTIALVHSPQYSPGDESQESQLSADEEDPPSEGDIQLQVQK